MKLPSHLRCAIAKPMRFWLADVRVRDPSGYQNQSNTLVSDTVGQNSSTESR